MFRVPSLGRVRHVRNLALAIAVFSVVATGLPVAGAVSVAPGAVAPTAGHSVSTHPIVSAPAPSASSPIRSLLPSHPLGTGNSGNLTFYSNNSSFAPSAVTTGGSCTQSKYLYGTYNYYYNYCYGGAVDPTIVNFANGDIGVGYSVAIDRNIGSCAGATGNVSDLVGFSVSADGGHTFANATYLGNLTCRYYNAIEPSFTVAPNGDVYGVYVEENHTAGNGQGGYTSRAGDALGFTVSSNGGATFSPPVPLNSSGNISRPQIVSFGASLYVLFENISNGTSSFSWGTGSCCGYPVSLNLLYSSDGGATWQGPYVVPGENATASNSTLGAWMQVNATGTVGISYFTNHHCVYIAYSYCYKYGDDLVFATSTTNGSTWSSPVLVAPNVGETAYYTSYYSANAYFDVVTSSHFVFGPSGNDVYIAYAGTYNKFTSTYYYYNYEYSGIFEATGTIGGASWTVSAIQTTLDYFNYDNQFNPSIGWVGSTLYLAFSWENTTYCYSSCNPVEYTYSEWATTSADGLTWAKPGIVDVINMRSVYYYCGYYCGEGFVGFQSSVGSTASATPLMAFTLPPSYSYAFSYHYNGTAYNYYYNYSYPARLEVAFPYTGPTVSVNFTEQNLPAGTAWSFSVDGATVSTTSTSYTVNDVPVNYSLAITPNPVPAGYWQIISPASSVGPEVSFDRNSTVWFNYSVSYGIALYIEPSNPYDAELEINYNGSYYYTYAYTCIGCTTYTYTYPSFPWYFAVGTHLLVTSYGYPLDGADYWTGNGAGSYNGSGSQANLTVGGVLNETGWFGGFGSYDVQVNPVGLPATSVYDFAFDGTAYSAAGDTSVTVHNVGTGAHSVSGITANASTSGWEYFGYSTPASPFIVPIEPIVNLSFALVDLAASPGTVTFQAQGLTSGTVWTFGFNGTVYSSSTPWINVTTRPGTFPVQGFPVTALNASVGYVPTGLAATLSVTTGSTYVIDFTQAYKVQILDGNGGSVSGAGTFWDASGSSVSVHATAHNNYGFGDWSGSGTGSYTGTDSYANFTVSGPIVETANFYPLPTDRFNLTVTEVGLGNGTWWTVYVGGVGYSSDQPTFQIQNLYPCGDPSGSYSVAVPYAYSADGLTRYVPSSRLPSTICTNGATVLSVTFASQYFLTLQSTAGGFAEASVGLFTTTSGLWVPASLSVQLTAVTLANYTFVQWTGTGPGNWTGPGASQSVVLTGPVTETAVFAKVIPPAPTLYTVDFKLASTLATGTTWSVTLGGVSYSSATSDLYVPGLKAGSYPLVVSTSLSPDGLTQYQANGDPTSVSVTHNQTLAVTFQTYYWFSVSATAGGQATPASHWVVAGGSVLLNASPEPGYVFVGWAGTGAASYTGPNEVSTLPVSSPVSEVAMFQLASPPGGPGTQSSTSSSFWGQTTTWIIFAIVGLIAGLLVGLVVTRRRRAPPMEPATVETEPPMESAAPPEGA